MDKDIDLWSKMLTSSSQYLRPDDLSLLPTTLDSKKSLMALLAQPCSAIGANAPNPKLISAAEKAISKKYSDEKSPVVYSPVDNKPSFQPYARCLTSREKTKTPEDRASVNAHFKTPVSSKGSAATTPVKVRCDSNQSSSSQRSSGPKLPFTPTALTASSESKESLTYKPNVPVTPSAFLGGMPPSGYPMSINLMTSSLMAAQHHALANGLNPYLMYARMKPPGSDLSACRDPYCTGCSLSSLPLNSAACPAGCTQCYHVKTPFSIPNGHPAAAAYAHAQFATQHPYVCSWMAGKSAYCGKMFGTSDELLQHWRSHTVTGMVSPSLSMLNARHPLLQRTYPTPPMSPLTPRFHPYSKPSHMVSSPSLPFPLPPHPSRAAYFPSYSLSGPRGSAPLRGLKKRCADR